MTDAASEFEVVCVVCGFTATGSKPGAAQSLLDEHIAKDHPSLQEPIEETT